jgi:MFS transporter, DHA1 family, tetracycline resistance protein
MAQTPPHLAASPSRSPLAALRRWLRWYEPWYPSYLLLGVTSMGLAPFLLPLAVARSGSAAHVGLVLSAMMAGELTSSLWGNLADRYRAHRPIYIGGLVVTALAFAALALSSRPAAWLVLALVMGIGSAASGTVANLFIVEARPKQEWDPRIGALQTFYNAGGMAGVLAGGLAARLGIDGGLVFGAAVSAVAVLAAWRTTRTPAGGPARPALPTRPTGHAPWPLVSLYRLTATLTPAHLARLPRTLMTPFGLLTLVWFVANAGPGALYTVYPLLMQGVFRIDPQQSSVLMAVATGLGILLYSPAGSLSARVSAAPVLKWSLAARLAALVVMALAGASLLCDRGLIAAGAFLVVALVWPLISVSSTVLTSDLAPHDEGEAMGLYNAGYALAGLVGAALAGWSAAIWGYNAVTVVAAVGVAVGLLLALPLRGRGPHPKRVLSAEC